MKIQERPNSTVYLEGYPNEDGFRDKIPCHAQVQTKQEHHNRCQWFKANYKNYIGSLYYVSDPRRR